MARALRPIGHEDRLTLVDHLDELRRRLVVSIIALLAAFSFCFWQNNAILDIVTKPVRETQNLQDPSKASKDPLEQAARFQREQGQALRAIVPALGLTGKTLRSLSGSDNVSAAQQRQLDAAAVALATASRQVAQAAQALPRNNQRNLVTLGVTEPFTATITLAFYGALLLAMPFLLYQAYAFILPAFSPKERRVALPLMLMVPVLFICGVLFGYFVVLSRAVEFLQNFNDDSFDILLQAKEYFKFAVFFLAGIGMLFQIPVGVLAVTRLGIFTPKQLAKNRGYVILAIAVLAAVATPTPDPVTMTLAMAPLILLFELSILLARWIDRIKPPVDEDDDDADGDDDPEPGPKPDDDPLAEYEDDEDDEYEDEDDDDARRAAATLADAAAAVEQAAEAASPEPRALDEDLAPGRGRDEVGDGPKLKDTQVPTDPHPKD
ncbi:MAG TPA: twin-arginine translocase subunit TatC [Solirubrobacteraceae bacterium]|jgi:sec-independent protein translocase protein TatC|nr:twin-arginine translocase subunit TatC [Solirubrobacteraceae bacterium]